MCNFGVCEFSEDDGKDEDEDEAAAKAAAGILHLYSAVLDCSCTVQWYSEVALLLLSITLRV